jgi:hypothetical protein
MDDEISYAEPSPREVQSWAFRTLHVLYALGLRSGDLWFVREDAWDALRRLAGGEPTTPQEMRAALDAIGMPKRASPSYYLHASTSRKSLTIPSHLGPPTEETW